MRRGEGGVRDDGRGVSEVEGGVREEKDGGRKREGSSGKMA